MTNDNSIANGVPMTLGQMQGYLQGYYGYPVTLRKQGTTSVKCPFCQGMHEHEPNPGHYVAGCDEEIGDTLEIKIGARSFNCNFGYTIFEYKELTPSVYEINSVTLLNGA